MMKIDIGRCLLLAIALIIALAAQGSARAQTGENAAHGGLTQAELETLIEKARTQGVEVIVVSPLDEAADAAALEVPLFARLNDTLSLGSEGLRALIEHIPNVPRDMVDALAPTPGDAGSTGLVLVLAVVIALLLASLVGERVYFAWLDGKLRTIWPDPPGDASGKTAFLLFRLVARVVGMVALSALVYTIASLVLSDNGRVGVTVMTLVGAQLAVRVMIEFWRAWISPGRAEFRIPEINDRQAAQLFNWLRVSAIIITVPVAACFWLEALGINHSTHTLLLMAASVMILAFHLLLVSRTRHTVACIIAGAGGDARPTSRMRRVLAANWHLFLGAYILVTGGASLVQLALGNANPVGPSGGMILLLAATLTLHAVLGMLIDWWFHRRASAFERREISLAQPGEAIGAPEADAATSGADATDSGEAEGLIDDAPKARRLLREIRTFEDLARQAVECTVAAFAAGAFVTVWGGDLTAQGGALSRVWDIALVAIMGYVAFQSIKILIQQRLAREDGLETPTGGGEGAGVGVSRVATLLPLFRNFTLIAIAITTMMIILSQLGIDIAPLFAGAGVIGLAIGFGAQALIRDIISGAFFLMDDAFRKGEYINMGEIEGTVERISIRSMQVRHYDGPLHTIPFGEIHHLTNYSRDWALMKLKLRVPYDTDIEKVRRLIKKLGKELLQDEELGPMFLEPLKSQGVNSMEDSAMVLRLKFMSRPGDQFYLKRQIYSRIQDLFQREGIRFAHRMVTVRLADDDVARDLGADEKRAVAGAVAPLLDEQHTSAKGSAPDR